MTKSHTDPGSGNNVPETLPRERKPYSRPMLREYGSVSTLTRGSGGTSTDANGMMNQMASDRRVKENIMKIGEHPLGISLYLFDYKSDFRDAYSHDRQFGVMADEVEAAMPAAVSVGRHGYKQVDYAMLGITLPAR